MVRGNRLGRLRDDERGQDLIEYALMVGLAALVLVAALPELRQSIGSVFTSVIRALQQSAQGPGVV
jgi:Flp pilus assembly pilin Flp